MLKGKTKSGFEFEVNEKLLDNMELLEMFAQIKTDETVLPELIGLYLGEEQKKALYNHVRTKKGNVPIEKTMDTFLEIMDIVKGKNSKN